ncbi:hypothetical protein V8F20_010819 [Naviculisporaceae sp. PSN 640]
MPDRPLNVNLGTYLSNNPTVAKLIVCAIVIHKNSHVLLTILHALARELHEETGLQTKHVLALVDDKTEFEGRDGVWRKITCLVEVEDGGNGIMPEVRLEALEHQDFVWATEEEVSLGRVGIKNIKFAYEVQRQTIKVAFGLAAMSEGSSHP